MQPRRVSSASLSILRARTHHRNSQESHASGQGSDDEVDGSIGTESTGQRNEQVKESDESFDAEEEGSELSERKES